MKRLLTTTALATTLVVSPHVFATETPEFSLAFHCDGVIDGAAGQHISVDLFECIEAITPDFKVLDIERDEVTFTPTRHLPRGFKLIDGVISGTPGKGAHTYQIEIEYRGQSITGTSGFTIF